jgi:hypothetical protein
LDDDPVDIERPRTTHGGDKYGTGTNPPTKTLQKLTMSCTPFRTLHHLSCSMTCMPISDLVGAMKLDVHHATLMAKVIP